MLVGYRDGRSGFPLLKTLVYWNNNIRQYHPDFVAETDSTIFLIETKKSGDIPNEEVQEKAKAALEYCHYASSYNQDNSGKPWKYVLIPHNAVLLNMSFSTLMKSYEYKSKEP